MFFVILDHLSGCILSQTGREVFADSVVVIPGNPLQIYCDLLYLMQREVLVLKAEEMKMVTRLTDQQLALQVLGSAHIRFYQRVF
jgi:hypothetical protein